MFIGLLIGAALGTVLILTIYRPSAPRQSDKTSRRDDFRKAA
jgi:hypothetical protein